MALQITQLMYSGLPNPSWILDGAEEQEFRQLAASSAADSATPIPPYRMGFRGFRIVDPAQGFRVLGRSIPSFSFAGAPELQLFLLDTSPFPPRYEEPAPPADLSPAVARAAPRAPSLAVDAPLWDPDDPRWLPPNQDDNNCYSYAANRANPLSNGIIAQFGSANRLFPITVVTGSSCLRGALSDGLIVSQGPSQSLAAGQGHHACIVVNPYRDFHLYRQDSDGGWSHKIDVPTRLDHSGNVIIDPRLSDRSGYALFVAWVIVPPTLQISG